MSSKNRSYEIGLYKSDISRCKNGEPHMGLCGGIWLNGVPLYQCERCGEYFSDIEKKENKPGYLICEQ